LQEIGVDASVRRQYVGHTAKDSHDGYAALTSSDSRAAKRVLEKVNQLAKSKPDIAYFPPIKGKKKAKVAPAITKSGDLRLRATRAVQKEDDEQQDD